MTRDEQANLIDRKLIEYTNCRKEILCLETSLKDMGVRMRDLASAMISCPEFIELGEVNENELLVRSTPKGDMKVAVDVSTIKDCVDRLNAARSEAKELGDFLRGTEHAHMVVDAT